MRKEEQWRREGMGYALQVAREGGVEALEAEMKRRGVTVTPIGITKKQEDDFVMYVKTNCIVSFTGLVCMILRDEFGFGAKRMARFAERFYNLCDSVADQWLTYQDIYTTIKEETGLDLLEYRRQANEMINGVERKISE